MRSDAGKLCRHQTYSISDLGQADNRSKDWQQGKVLIAKLRVGNYNP